MKRLVYFAAAVLALAACQKEVDAPQAIQANTHTVTISAGFDAQTKTAYDTQGKFAWVAGDKIGVLVTNGETTKQVSFTTSDSGPVATFTGQVEDGYELALFASYPFDDTNTSNVRNDLAFDSEKSAWRLWGSIKPDVENPLASTPLYGIADSDGNYQFKTATGIVKFTVENVPEETAFAYMSVPSTSEANLNGWYKIDTDGGIKMSNATEPWQDRYNWNVPKGVNTTMDYYFFIPTGTLPAGTTFSLCNSSYNVIKSFEFKQDVEVVRNVVTSIAPIVLDPVLGPAWQSIGNGKFIDTYIWNIVQSSYTDPVSVEFFADANHPDSYRMVNPYPVFMQAVGGTVLPGADEYLYFSIGEKGRIVWEWCNMGIAIKGSETWAMISGDVVAGYGTDMSHIVARKAEGDPIQIQMAPCYRASSENCTGEPTTYDNEIGKDHNNGVVEIVFPGNELLMPVTIEHISVSSNQSGDGQGAAGLVDNKLNTFWHTPWSSASTTFDPVYGEYVQIALTEGISTFAFNYCTRSTTSQDGSPATVVVGASLNGKVWVELGTFELDFMNDVSANTWVGLPTVNAANYNYLRFGVAKNQKGEDLRNITSAEQWCNLAELMVYAVSTGEPIEYRPDWLEDYQVYVKPDMIIKASATASYDGGGIPALVDGDPTTYWHTDYYYAITDNDPEYGMCIDIALEVPLREYHFEYVNRATSAGAKPTSIVLGVSDDGTTWTKVSELSTEAMTGAGAGERVKLPVVSTNSAHSYLRFGITDSSNGDEGSLTGDLNFEGYKKCVNLAELLLFSDETK